MRAATLGLIVFALGLATAALVASPRAGARATAGSLSGSVGPGFTISMSASSVPAGDYTINVTDSSNIHNFHLSGPGVSKSTSIGGTGSTSWSVTLQPGTYTFQCDAHPSTMTGSLTVTDATTTTTDTTSTTEPTTTTAPTTTTEPTTTTGRTTTARTTTERTTTERTTTERTTTERTTTEATTSEAAATTEAETTTTAAAATTEAETTTEEATTTAAAPKPLRARVAAARATPKTVSVTVTSNERGTALAQLFSGGHRVAKATGRVPGRLVLRPARPLKAGLYVLKLRVTAGGKTTTSSRTIRVR